MQRHFNGQSEQAAACRGVAVIVAHRIGKTSTAIEHQVISSTCCARKVLFRRSGEERRGSLTRDRRGLFFLVVWRELSEDLSVEITVADIHARNSYTLLPFHLRVRQGHNGNIVSARWNNCC